MGAASSVQLLNDEARKPLDASDVDTPRGKSAKLEVARLRKLLSENFESVSQLLFTHFLSSPRRDEEESAAREEAPNYNETDFSAVANLDNEYGTSGYDGSSNSCEDFCERKEDSEFQPSPPRACFGEEEKQGNSSRGAASSPGKRPPLPVKARPHKSSAFAASKRELPSQQNLEQCLEEVNRASNAELEALEAELDAELAREIDDRSDEIAPSGGDLADPMDCCAPSRSSTSLTYSLTSINICTSASPRGVRSVPDSTLSSFDERGAPAMIAMGSYDFDSDDDDDDDEAKD
mmetsp:Transcript_32938/g.67347  ORF Transcript_32938/g.67347 Transcript_32938/m.67347 type:complete len:292 (+) Transcript_32938:91-966(+)